MSRCTRPIIAAALAVALGAAFTCGSAAAQQRKEAPAATRTKAEPSTWDKTKDMTRQQWNKARKAWAKEKDKWRDCNAQSKKDKLSGTKRWTSIGKCMTS